MLGSSPGHALPFYQIIQSSKDWVGSNCIWKITTELGIPGKLVTLTKAYTNNLKCGVMIQGEVYEAFKVRTGLRQFN